MLLNYIYVAVFASFPEALFILLLGFNLSNFRDYSISKLLIISCIQSIIALFIRALNVNIGVHTIIQILSLYLLVLSFFKIEYYKAIIPILIGSLTQGVIQSIVMPVFSIINNWGLISIYNNYDKAILSSIPIIILSLILFIFVKEKSIVLCNINR